MSTKGGTQYVYWYCGRHGMEFDEITSLLSSAIDNCKGWGRGYAEIPGTAAQAYVYYDAGIDGWDSTYGIVDSDLGHPWPPGTS